MTKLKGPLFSATAHGTLGEVLTYSTRKIVKQVRFQRKQKDKVTPLRTTQREYFRMAISWWHELTSEEQSEWASIGRGY